MCQACRQPVSIATAVTPSSIIAHDQIDARRSSYPKRVHGRRCAVPWLTRLATAVLRGRLEQEQDGLARDAVRNLERLGPTFLKLGQVLSIR